MILKVLDLSTTHIPPDPTEDERGQMLFLTVEPEIPEPVDSTTENHLLINSNDNVDDDFRVY